MKILDALAPYRKALVPLVVAAVLAALAAIGISSSMTVEEAVVFVVTAGLVYLVPNRS